MFKFRSTLCLVLVVLAAGFPSRPLAAQDQKSRDALFEASLAAELNGDHAAALEILERLRRETEGDSADLAGINMARILIRQGKSEEARKILEPLLGRDDAIGAAARRLGSPDSPTAPAARRMDPVLNRIADLNDGDCLLAGPAQVAHDSLERLGALVVPVLIEQFESLGPFGRRNAMRLLGRNETELGVQLLFEDLIRADRQAETLLILSEIGSWKNESLRLKMARIAMESKHEACRERATLIAADLVVKFPELAVDLRRRLRDYIEIGIVEAGTGRVSELVMQLLEHPTLRPDDASYDRFLDLRVMNCLLPVQDKRFNSNSSNIDDDVHRLWLARVGPDEERFRIVAGKATPERREAILAANLELARPNPAGLRLGLMATNAATHASCRDRMDELELEITTEEWCTVLRLARAGDQSLMIAYSRLGDRRDATAVTQALLDLAAGRWYGISGAALRYLGTVAPEFLPERLGTILDDEGGRQVLRIWLSEEPGPTKASLVMKVLRHGHSFDSRMLPTIAFGSDHGQLGLVLEFIQVAVTFVDEGGWAPITEAVYLALARITTANDLPVLLAALPRTQASAAGYIRHLVESFVTAKDHDVLQTMINELLDDMAADRDRFLRGPQPAELGLLGRDEWRGKTMSPVEVLRFLIETDVGLGPVAEGFAFEIIGSVALDPDSRRRALIALLEREDIDRPTILRRLLELPDFPFLDLLDDQSTLVSDADLRERVCALLLSSRETGYMGNFIAALDEATARGLGTQLLDRFVQSAGRDSSNASPALRRLGDLKDPAYIPRYEALLETSLGLEAIVQLGRLYDRRAVPILVKALKSDRSEIVLAAETWLQKLESYFEKEERWGKLAEPVKAK